VVGLGEQPVVTRLRIGSVVVLIATIDYSLLGNSIEFPLVIKAETEALEVDIQGVRRGKQPNQLAVVAALDVRWG
jgi:hypothetical protein